MFWIKHDQGLLRVIGWLAVVPLLLASGFAYYLIHQNVIHEEAHRSSHLRNVIEQNAMVVADRISEGHLKGHLIAQSSTFAELLRSPSDNGVRRGSWDLGQRCEEIRALACYLLDSGGTVVATSNYGAEGSFLSKNYAFRKYFKQARSEGQGFQLAIGVTSQEPGLYFSRAIKDSVGKFLGVLVIKESPISMLTLDRLGGEQLFIVSEDRVIFASTVPQLFRVKLSDESSIQEQIITELVRLNILVKPAEGDVISQAVPGHPKWLMLAVDKKVSILGSLKHAATWPVLLIGLIIFMASAAISIFLSRLAKQHIDATELLRRELESSNERLEDAQAIGAIGDWSLDLQTMQLAWSPETKRIFGVPGEGFTPTIEQTLAFAHPDDRGRLDAMVQKSLSEFSDLDVTYRIIRSDGRERTLHACGVFKPNTDEPRNFVGTVQDVTERALPQIQTSALLELSEKSFTMNEEELLQHALLWCEKVTGSNISFLHFVNEDQETIQLVTWSEQTLATYCHVEELDSHYPISEAGIWADAFRQRRPVVINDYERAAGKKGLPEGHAHLTRLISLPIIENDAVKVLFGVGNKQGHYTDDDVAAMGVIADYLWRIISRKRAEKVAEKADDTIRTLSTAIEQSPSSVILTDPNGVIEYVNPAFVEVTGYLRSEMVRQKPSILKSGETTESEYQELWRAIKAGKTWRGVFHNRCKDGALKWMRSAIAPIFSQDGQITHFLAVQEDITSEKEMRAALESEKRLNQMQRDFISLVSHEFRTPLSVIDSSAQRIMRKRDRMGIEEICERMSECRGMVRHLTDLMESVLGLSRLDSGKTTLEPHLLDVVALITDAVRHQLSVSPGRALNVLGTKEPILATVDPKLIGVILSNLLSNAVKYSDAGHPVEVSWVFSEDTVVISVRDFGRGIPSDEHAKIFERFFRASSSTGVSGSGIGLFLSQEFARMHGGEISFESEEGQGTTFFLRLPLGSGEFEAKGGGDEQNQ